MVHFRKNKKSTDQPLGPRRLIIQNFNLTVMIKQYSNKIIKSFYCTNVYKIRVHTVCYKHFSVSILSNLMKSALQVIKCQDQFKANTLAIIMKV